ncbi:MAG: 3-coathanger stack domain-containing protein, partial [Bacteroidota bacterium]
MGMALSGGAAVGYSVAIDSGKPKNAALNLTEESQDQAYYLLMGLALTSKLVDDVPDGNNVFGYGSGETKLQTEAKNIASRIINHIKSDPLWRIRNPANGNAFVQIGQYATPYSYALDNLGCFIKYGQDLPAFTFNFPPQSIFGYPYNNCTDFSNVYSRSPAGASGWQIVAYQNGGFAVDQMGFFHVLAGSANCVFEPASASNLVVQAGIDAAQAALNSLYEQGNNAVTNFLNGINLPPAIKNALNWVIAGINAIWAGLQVAIDAAQNIYNNYSMAINNGLLMNTTDYRLYQNTKFHQVNYFNNCDVSNGTLPIPHTGSDAYFGMYLKDALRIDYPTPSLPGWVQFIKNNIYNADRSLVKNDMINILNSAPCNGNYNYDPNNNPGPHWGATNRIDRIDHLWNLNCWKEGSQGDLAGLDYLLLHNLYYLTEGTSAPISNYSARKVSLNMPFTSGNTLVFSSNNKKTLGAFEFIEASNIIASNGAADYRAGKEVALLDGFSTVIGSDFHAYISPFNGTCNNDEMMRQNNSYSNDDFFDGISDYDSKPSGNNPIKKALIKNEYDENLANQYTSELQTWLNENTTKVENFN